MLFRSAQEVSLRLIQSRDHLLSIYKEEPEVNEFFHPRQPSSDEPSTFWIVQNISKIGQGTHDPSQVDEQYVLRRARAMTQDGYDLANMLFARRQPLPPDTPAREAKSGLNFDFLKHLPK